VTGKRSVNCVELEGDSMSLAELEMAVSHLPPTDLTAFASWFEEFIAEAWDRQLESDIASGRLDAAGQQADHQFEAGHSETRAQRLVCPSTHFTGSQTSPPGPLSEAERG
jgi:hypothetical protein